MKTAEDIVKEKHRNMVSISADRTVREALHRMNTYKIGAILVCEGGKIIGIWTERDLLKNAATAGFDPATNRVGDYMTAPVRSVPHDTPLVKLKEMFLGLYIRHLLVAREGEFIGLLSIGDVLRASLIEDDRHIRELNAVAEWEYYENWGLEPEKK
jgi:CBS domain-containing protein